MLELRVIFANMYYSVLSVTQNAQGKNFLNKSIYFPVNFELPLNMLLY